MAQHVMKSSRFDFHRGTVQSLIEKRQTIFNLHRIHIFIQNTSTFHFIQIPSSISLTI
jgi:hypothetical protein